MRKRLMIALVVPGSLAAAILAGGGCSCRKEPVAAADVPLAEVNGQAITQADFDFEVQRRLASSRPVGTPDAILQDLVDRRIMLQQAEQSASLEDPAVRRELENQKLAHWLAGTLQARKDAVTVSDEELRQAYEADRAAHTQSGRVRLAILYRRLGRQDGEDRREALRTELQAARDRYLADPDGVTQNGRISGFGKVAAEASEDTVSRYRGGDLGWLEPGRQDYHWPAAVIEAGIALPTGQPSDVLAAGDGLYIVMKTGEREARITPFEEAVASLRRRLLRERQDAVEKSFKENLLAGAKVHIDPKQAARLKVPESAVPQAPALTPRGERAPAMIVP